MRSTGNALAACRPMVVTHASPAAVLSPEVEPPADARHDGRHGIFRSWCLSFLQLTVGGVPEFNDWDRFVAPLTLRSPNGAEGIGI